MPVRSSRGRLRAGRRSRRSPPHVRRRSIGIVIVLVGVLIAVPWVACIDGPPRDADDLCSIFREKRSWHRSARRSFEQWGVPEAVQLAIIHQESSFRATARPKRRRVFWIFPGTRTSSAFGYGQVVDSTWDQYTRDTLNSGASRDDFADVTDFIGWYGDRIHRRTGVAKSDGTELYAAYHEGPGGYNRGSHLEKAWLARVSRQVGRRASRYQAQYDGCRESLSRRRFLGIF